MKRIDKIHRAVIAVLRFCGANFDTFETDFQTLASASVPCGDGFKSWVLLITTVPSFSGSRSGPGGAGSGQLLRAARLERGLSIDDVARQLRLSVRQVIALEEDDYSRLSSATFLRGFVRNYAKLLQMDAAPLLQRVQESLPPPHTNYFVSD